MMATGAGLDKKNANQDVDAPNESDRAIHPLRGGAGEPMG
jgi:hypothetical protein